MLADRSLFESLWLRHLAAGRVELAFRAPWQLKTTSAWPSRRSTKPLAFGAIRCVLTALMARRRLVRGRGGNVFCPDCWQRAFGPERTGGPPGGGPPVLDCVKGVFAGVGAQATESRQAFVFMKTGARTPENQPTDAA